MQLLQRNKFLLLSCLIVLGACAPVLWGLLHPGFFVSDDGNWMVIRFSAFYEALHHGQFPVRFLPRLMNGYGYPVEDFLYPLFMYLGVPIHIVGINFVNTIKILFGLSILGSGIFTFLWLKKLFETKAALIGAIVFVYFPYHIYDLYVRGSMGEVLALCIVPFILWQIERKNLLLIGTGVGFLIISHNSLAVMTLPIVIAYYYTRQKNLKNIFTILCIGLGLSCFFWLPALFDQQFTVFQTKQVSDVSQYFLGVDKWYLFGLGGVLGLCFGLISFIKRYKLAVGFAILLIASLILALPISSLLWQYLPLGKYIQFPFRFLSLSIVASSFLIAWGTTFINKKYQTFWVFSIAAVLVAFGLILLPRQYQTYPDTWYSTNQDSTTVKNEYLPKWVNEIPTNRTQIAQIVKGEAQVSEQAQQGSNILVKITSKSSSIIQLNTIYFPGWKVLVDQNEAESNFQNKNGLMRLAVPQGDHIIKASFQETPLRLFADLVSLLSLICLCLYSLLQYRRR